MYFFINSFIISEYSSILLLILSYIFLVVGIEMEWNISYDDAHDPKYGNPVQVPIIIANDETLRCYARVVTDFYKEEVIIVPWPVQGWRKLHPGSGILGGVREGDTICKWEGDTSFFINKAVGCGDKEKGIPNGRLPKDVDVSYRTHVLVRVENYHPDGGQVFYPRDGHPFVIPMALQGDDVKPESFVAFYFDGTFGLHILPNVWHQAPIAIRDETVFLNKQGAVHGSVECDTVIEFGKYLRIPLIPDEV